MSQKKRSRSKTMMLWLGFLAAFILFPLVCMGSVRIKGLVVNEKGEPINGARITAVYWKNPLVKKEEIHKTERRSEVVPYIYDIVPGIDPSFLDHEHEKALPHGNLPQAKRETHSDKEGKWALYFVRKGNWRITAYSDETMSFPINVDVPGDTPEIKLKLDITSTRILIEVKRYIYKRNFQKAIELLNWFKHRFPRSRNLENSVYWLAYCQYKLIEDTLDDRDKKKIGVEAIKNLDELIDNFPKGEWADDAKILRIEFAQELVKLGADKYKKYIIEAVQSTDRSEFDIKIAALAALVTIDRGKAVQHLIDIIKQERDSELRKKAIFILASNKIEVAIPVIKRAAEKDSDESVRFAASSWLNWLKNTIRR